MQSGKASMFLIYLYFFNSFYGCVSTQTQQADRLFEVQELQQHMSRNLKIFENSRNKTSVQFKSEAIIGADERVEVKDTTVFPFSAVVQFDFICPLTAQPYSCSGAMVGPRTVLTSAHCVYERYRNEGRYCSDYVVTPGMQKTVKPFGSIKATPVAPDIFVKGNYYTFEESDYALLILDQDIGLKTGWFSVEADCSETYYQKIVTCGYPGDLQKNVMVYSTCPGKIDPCERRGMAGSFKHVCDTAAGQSGSPMWTTDSQGDPVIRAVHSSGARDTNKVNYNLAIYISENAQKWILANAQ